METSFNLSSLNKNNLDTARILNAFSVYHPADLAAAKDLPLRSGAENTVKNKSIIDQQLLVDRLVNVLEKSLMLLVEKVVAKLEDNLNKSSVSENNSLEQEKPTGNLETASPLPLEKNCLCNQGLDLPSLLNNQLGQTPGLPLNDISKNSDILSYIQNAILGFPWKADVKDSLTALNGLFTSVFESVKNFLKKPGGMFKDLFQSGVFSGAAKLLGGLL